MAVSQRDSGRAGPVPLASPVPPPAGSVPHLHLPSPAASPTRRPGSVTRRPGSRARRGHPGRPGRGQRRPLPGPRDPHGHPVRGHQQEGQQVEQAQRDDRRPVGRPPAPAPVGERAEQQVGRYRRAHGDETIGAGVLRVPGHLRGRREQQPGHDTGQRRCGQPGGPGEAAADRGGDHRRHRHRQQGRQPQRCRRGARHPGPGVHEDVVGAIDGVGMGQHRQDPRQRAADGVDRVGLVAPQRQPPEPVAVRQQQHDPRDQRRGPAGHRPFRLTHHGL